MSEMQLSEAWHGQMQLLNMEMADVVGFFKKQRVCFNCLGTDHMSKWCKEEGYKCEKDGMKHPTVLCWVNRYFAKQRELKKAREESGKENTRENANANANTNANPNISTA